MNFSPTLKEGDLVVIVDGCCDRARSFALGVHATILHLYEKPGMLCMYCKAPIPSTRAHLSHRNWDSPAVWLKRIPPLGELDDVKREEEITA